MHFGDLVSRLRDDAAAAEILLAAGDLVCLARVNEMSALYDESVGEYASNAIRRFSGGATHEDWLSLMTILGSAADPAAACLLRVIDWALDQDKVDRNGDDGLVGALVYEESGVVNALMAHCAEELMSEGFRLSGLIQANYTTGNGGRCDMSLRELMSGVVVPVSEDRGTGSRGCRLDYAAFTRATQLCQQALEVGPDIMFVNKFGKLEAQGKGLREVIAEALIAGIPVLIGVPHRNLVEFQSFVGGPYRQLTADVVLSWCWRQIAVRRQ